MNYDEINTESSLNEDNGVDSKREMMFKSLYPNMLQLNRDNKATKNKSNKYNNINSNFNKNINNNKNNIGISLYQKAQKEKKKELMKSVGNPFGVLTLKNKKKDDIIFDKKEKDKHKREERTSKSIKKKKNFSKNNYKEKEEIKSNDDSPTKKEIFYNNCNNKHEYIGVKILINMNDLNSIFSKYNESNNISDFKKEELSDENIYEKRHRLSCIINNSPFIDSNIYLENKKCITSMEPLIGQDKCRFMEKNKNIYKNKSFKEIFAKIKNEIFQEIDSDINDKLYEIDPNKISIGQIYKKDNKYIRNISNLDGNSFLKAFIFNYLEQLISRKDLNKIREIIGRIKVGLKIIKKDENTINKVLSIFKIIVKYLEEDNISNAYIILIKSFSENYEFENNLMLFMRQSLSESIERHYIYFIIEYLKEIVSKKYIKIDDKNNKEYFDYKLYLKEIINPESNNNELQYELLVYYFLAPIFEVDLIIYTDNDSKTNKITFKHTNIPSVDKDIITIELFIGFGNISILYSEQYFQKYENIIPLKSKNEYPIDKIQILKNEEKKNCYMCHNIPNEFIQIDYKFELICKKCLNEIIQKIIKKRYFLFSDTDNYFHEEFYCNKINYVINQDQTDSYELNISINDIKSILKNNLDIASEIHNKIIKNNKCIKCQKNFGKSLYCYCMNKCGHLICSNCLKDYIYEVTDEKVVLNIYENKLKKIEFFCPECNEKIFLSKNLINNLFNDDTLINKAEERLIESAETICCFCGLNDIDKIKNKFVIENNSKSSNKLEQNYLLVHALCIDCYKKLKKKDLNDKDKTFLCDFCGEEHHYDKIKFSIKKRQKSCCIHF